MGVARKMAPISAFVTVFVRRGYGSLHKPVNIILGIIYKNVKNYHFNLAIRQAIRYSILTGNYDVFRTVLSPVSGGKAVIFR